MESGLVFYFGLPEVAINYPQNKHQNKSVDHQVESHTLEESQFIMNSKKLSSKNIWNTFYEQKLRLSSILAP